MSRTTIDQLSAYGFRHTHDLFIEGGNAAFCRNADPIQNEGLYAFVSPIPGSENKVDVLYVGSGSKLERRLCQYIRIFGASARSTAKTIRERINELWNEGRRLQVFSRPSAKITLFGQETPLYLTEELALIRALHPNWNSHGRG